MASDAPSGNHPAPNPSAPPPRGAGAERSLIDYLLAIRARWKFALLVALLGAGTLYFVQSRQEPVYSSKALLRFSPGETLSGDSGGLSRNALESRLRNAMQDMAGIHFKNQIVQSFGPDEVEVLTRDYADPDGTAPAVGSIYSRAFNIEQRDSSHFLLDFQHRNPEASRLLVHRFVEEFARYLEDQSRRQNEAAIRYMRWQVDEFRLKVERGEMELQEYQQEHGVILQEGENFNEQQLAEIRARLSSQELSLINFETYVEEIQNAQEEGRPLEELPFIREYGQVEHFVNTLVNLRQERQNLAVRYGERHPRMLENTAASESARQGLDDAIRQAVNKVRVDHEAQRKSVAALQGALAVQQDEAKRLDMLRIEYRNMQTRLATDRQLYVEMLRELNNMQTRSRLGAPTVRLVDGGGLPSVPISPDHEKITVMSMALFVFLFLGYPIGMDFLDGRLRTRQGVEDQLLRTYLGQVPKLKRGARVDPYVVALAGKPRDIIESLRIVHSQFQMALPSRSGQVIVVTSLIPGEGKSFMSISLAALMAKHHRQVLVVDCDLRRPAIIAGLEQNGRELRHVREIHEVMQLGTDEPALIEEVQPGLHVMSLGQNPDDPTEIFEDARFKQLVQRFRQEYDMVILDTPPAGVFSDAAMLGPLSDGYMLVLKHNTHATRKVRNVIRDLEKNNVSVLGVVFNKVVGKFSRGTDDYHRGKYYDYYAKGASKGKPRTRRPRTAPATTRVKRPLRDAEEDPRESAAIR